MGRVLVIDDDAGVRESFRRGPGGRADYTVDDRAKTALPESSRRERRRPDPGVPRSQDAGPVRRRDPATALHDVLPGHAGLYRHRLLRRLHWRALRVICESNGIDFANLARKPLTVGEIQMIAASQLAAARNHRKIVPALPETSTAASKN